MGEKGRPGRRDRFLDLVDHVEGKYKKCGSDPFVNDATRKRRETDPEANDSDDEWNDRFRLSKDNREKAVKQLSNILTRFGNDYLTGCKRTPEKLAARADNIRDKWNDMGCAK